MKRLLALVSAVLTTGALVVAAETSATATRNQEPAPSDTVRMIDSTGKVTEIPVPDEPAPQVVPAEQGDGNLGAIENATLNVELPPEATGALPAGPQAESGQVSPFVVIGMDERVQRNARAVPYIQQPLLLSMAADGTSWRCTGALVGPRTLVTAGHCLYSHESQGSGWRTSVNAFFGVERNAAGSNEAALSCPAERITAPEQWVNNGADGHDWGIVVLACNVGTHIGTMGYEDFGGLNEIPYTWNVSGYPGDKMAYTMWSGTGSISVQNAMQFRYQIDTAGGQSGGPIWRDLSSANCNGACLIGVHTTGHRTILGQPSHNSGTRMSLAFKAATDQYRFW